MGGRQWSVLCVPAPEFFSSRISITPWFLLATGIFISVILSVYAEAIIGRTAYAEEMVQARTAEVVKSEKRAKVALKAKSEFTAMVSHELRTPLTAIKEGIGIVMEGSCGTVNEEQGDYLALAKRNVDRLGRLINDVLDIQKMGDGMMEFDIRENDINKSVLHAHRTMRSLAEEKGLRFEMEAEGQLPRVAFDEDRISQVLVNLLSNAIRFTQKGHITVRTENEGNAVKISVLDSGPGIKEEDMDRLFQKFEQLSPARDRIPGGTGLGLAISMEIIEAHKGRIWAESVHGKSTTFFFVLPAMDRNSPS